MAPAVSIIMNCLDGARDLPHALDSVKSQTFQDWEIIFWDNGSKDASAAIAQSFDQRLRYFKGEHTVPLGEARNLAIAEAKGKYVAFLDCDDEWLPEKLQKQVEIFENDSEVGLVCTDTEIFSGARTLGRVFEASPPARGRVYDELIKRQWISMSSAMASRKALDSILPEGDPAGWFDGRFELCEEADVFYRIAYSWKLDYMPEALTRWRVHGQNSTFRNFARFSAETRMILEKHREIFPGFDEKHGDTARLLLGRAAFQEAVALWKDGKNSEARAKIRPWLHLGPKYRIFWAAAFLPGSLFNAAAKAYFALPGKFRR